jgi:hypothetical protein
LITARGVLNSWEASAINCFCLSKASLIGFIDLFAKNLLIKKIAMSVTSATAKKV